MAREREIAQTKYSADKSAEAVQLVGAFSEEN